MSRQPSVPPDIAPHVARLIALIEDRANQPGWSYQRIADEAGVNLSTITAIRKGMRHVPNPRTLRGLSRALGFTDDSVEQLLATGAEPVRIKEPEPEPPQDPLEAEIRAKPNLSEEERAIFVDLLREARRTAGQTIVDKAEELDRRRRGA